MEREEKMEASCDHVGLFSQNPEILVPFYTEKLGFENVGTKSVSKEWMSRIFGVPAECLLIKLRYGSAVVEIFVPQSRILGDKIAASQGYNHWGLGVEDKDSYVRTLEREGVPVLKLEGSGRFIYFIKDPGGNLIEIYEKKD
jgi:catechol 2,3-dioxygenase-like lactoylglutathione lyase family enzyme